MKSFINDVPDNWSVDLEDDSTLSQFMPMLNFTLINTGDSKVEIYMHGQRIGSCFGYSVFSMMGKPFETFRVTGTFNIGDIEVLASKMVTAAVMPYNPQIDLMEENLDKFASGTDKRVSYSSAVPPEMIKYVLNTNGGLIVQRKLDVIGSASVGSYEIDFNGDIVAGSTAINFPSLDLKRYKKTIPVDTFDYTFTDCTVAGWLIDYKQIAQIDLKNATVDSEGFGSGGLKMFDQLHSTYAGEYTTWGNSGEETFLVMDLGEAININNVHIGCWLAKNHATGTPYFRVYTSPNNTDWTKIIEEAITTTDYAWHSIRELNIAGANISYLKFTLNSAQLDYGSKGKFYELLVEA